MTKNGNNKIGWKILNGKLRVTVPLAVLVGAFAFGWWSNHNRIDGVEAAQERQVEVNKIKWQEIERRLDRIEKGIDQLLLRSGKE